MQNSCSGTCGMTLVTPQGGVLGPLIFLLYVNDLPSYITVGTTFLYADDCTIVVSDPNPDAAADGARGALQQFETWCSDNRLILNKEKTKLINFSYGYSNV